MDKSHQDSARKEQCVISPGSALGSSDKSNSSPPTQYASQMAKPCEKSESNVPLRVEKSWGQMIRDLEDMSPEEFTAKYKFKSWKTSAPAASKPSGAMDAMPEMSGSS